MDHNCNCEDISKCFIMRIKKIQTNFNGSDVCGNSPETISVIHRGERMRFISNRLKTFEKWTRTNIIKPYDLAVNGFYYLGEKDSVKCAFCGLGLENFEPGDDVRNEHIKWKKDCPFTNRYFTDNVSIPTERDEIIRIISVIGIFLQRMDGIYCCKICGVSFDKNDRKWSDVANDHQFWSPCCPVIEFIHKSYIKPNRNISEANILIEEQKDDNKCIRPILTDFMRIKETLLALCIKEEYNSDFESRKWLFRFDNWYRMLKNRYLIRTDYIEDETEWSIQSLMEVLTIIDVFKRFSQEGGEQASKYNKNLELIHEHISNKLNIIYLK